MWKKLHDAPAAEREEHYNNRQRAGSGHAINNFPKRWVTTPIITLSLASLEVIQPLAAAFVKTASQRDSKANNRF
jgi:hypothetical protein